MEYKEIDERASREHRNPNASGRQFLTELSVIETIPWVLPERPAAQHIFTESLDHRCALARKSGRPELNGETSAIGISSVREVLSRTFAESSASAIRAS